MPYVKEFRFPWQQLSKTYGPKFVKQVHATLSKPERRECDLPTRHFLGWLREQDDPAASGLVRLLADPPAQPADLRKATHTVVALLGRWTEDLALKGFTPKSVSQYAARFASSLSWLAEEHPERFPPLTRDMISIENAPGNVLSLGSLDWPELSGLSGATRERKALDLVRGRAMQVFQEAERRFAFGQAVLGEGVLPHWVDTDALLTVREFLLDHRANWCNGRALPPHDVTASFCARYGNAVLGAETWVRAGLPTECIPNIRNQDGLAGGKVMDPSNLLIDCLGPGTAAQRAAILVFCCDTGWNLQPILDLPRQPFVYQMKGEAGVGTAAFAASFKNRSHANIVAYLEDHEFVTGIMADNVRAEWEATVAAEDPEGTRDGYSILPRSGDASGLSLLRRFGRMADAARPFDVRGDFGERFFFYMGRTVGVHGFDGRTNQASFEDDDVLGREGITFQAVRKSFLAQTFGRTGSGTATSHVAGHGGFGTLPRHYLSTAELNAELDASVRFFQQACQSMLLEGRSQAVVALGLKQGDVAWFLRLARVTGISAALSRVETDVAGVPVVIAFTPSEKGLRELFVTHRALRMAFLRVSRQRWRVQGIPLLAAVKAVGKTLLTQKHLGPAYFAAARRAKADLTDGTATLPPLLEA